VIQKIALVVPAWNEAKMVGEVIDDLKKIFGKTGYDWRIVLVDDGSKDGTAEIAAQHGAMVIPHIINIGSGGATATGLSYAQSHGFDTAATLDADGQHSAADVLKGVELIQEMSCDLLIGSRLIDSHGMSKIKQIGNRGLTFLTFVLFGVKITDSQSGLRIFSRRALNDLKWKTAGFEFCSEMLWRAKQAGLDIREYPIKAIYTDYSLEKGQNNWNGFNIVKSLLRRRILELFGE
jgi:glycosyltransferase involved in cell wall biosynthesis